MPKEGNADPASFEVLDAYYARDKAQVFYGQTKLEGADRDSFEVVNPAERAARDNKGNWKRAERSGAVR